MTIITVKTEPEYKPESCINRTLNKVPTEKIFVNFTCIFLLHKTFPGFPNDLEAVMAVIVW
jgi:hypothetical protein